MKKLHVTGEFAGSFSLWSGHYDGAYKADGAAGQGLPESGEDGGRHDCPHQGPRHAGQVTLLKARQHLRKS